MGQAGWQCNSRFKIRPPLAGAEVVAGVSSFPARFTRVQSPGIKFWISRKGDSRFALTACCSRTAFRRLKAAVIWSSLLQPRNLHQPVFQEEVEVAVPGFCADVYITVLVYIGCHGFMAAEIVQYQVFIPFSAPAVGILPDE